MRRDDRDDPFGEFFHEFERMVNELFGEAGSFDVETIGDVDGRTHVDVHEEDDRIRVVADLPGVEKEAIDVTCDGRTLTIRADGAGRSYDERVRLPREVDESSASATYNNGVLELTFETRPGGRSIEID